MHWGVWLRLMNDNLSAATELCKCLSAFDGSITEPQSQKRAQNNTFEHQPIDPVVRQVVYSRGEGVVAEFRLIANVCDLDDITQYCLQFLEYLQRLYGFPSLLGGDIWCRKK